MSETKFTPGPWTFDGVDTIGSALANADVATLIAVKDSSFTHGGAWNTDIMEANAALIASAPDLYAALEELLRETGKCAAKAGDCDCPWNKAYAALAKARGEAPVKSESA